MDKWYSQSIQKFIDMVGSQFNIVYDKNILTLDDVIFDTGNTMTNFQI